MKYTKVVKLSINATLESSEMIMLNQGGMHKLKLDPELLIGDYDELEITLQMYPADSIRHDFILKEAANHISNLTPEELEARKRDENR